VALALVSAAIASACGAAGDGSATTATPATTATLPPAGSAQPSTCPFGAALVGFDETSGRMLWSRCAAAAGGIEALTADASTVLAAEYEFDGSGRTRLLGLDAATGAERWTTLVDAFNESYGRDAFYADGNRLGAGTVVFSQLAGDGHVMVGVDASTGAERWRVDAEGTFVTGHGEDVAVAASPGALFETPTDAPQPDVRVLGFDRRTGEVRWRRETGVRDLGAPWGPRTSGDLFAFTQVDPHAAETPPTEWRWRAAALDTATGDERWRRADGPLSLLSVTGEVGVGLSPRGSGLEMALIGFETSSGKRRWAVDLPQERPLVLAGASSPVVAVRDLGPAEPPTTAPAQGSTGPAATPAVTVYDRATGEQRWAVEAGAGTTLAAVASSTVFVTHGQDVVALDAGSGAVRWSAPFAHPHGVEVAAASDRVFLSSSSGMLDQQPADADAAPAPMSGMAERGTATLSTGETLRFAETAETGEGSGPGTMCIFVDGRAAPATCLPEAVSASAVGASLVPAAGAALELPSGTRSVHVVALPPGHPRPVAVRAGNGDLWPSAEAAGRDTLFIVEPTPSAGAGSIHEAVDIVSPDGSVIAGVGPASMAPPWLPAGFATLAACYRANGADYHAEPDGSAADAPPSTRLPAADTATAWQACRDVNAAATGGEPAEGSAAFNTCMAEQGWLPPLWFQHRDQWAVASATCGRPMTG
jgi:outer membrane protein assembly factor BamB